MPEGFVIVLVVVLLIAIVGLGWFLLRKPRTGTETSFEESSTAADAAVPSAAAQETPLIDPAEPVAAPGSPVVGSTPPLVRDEEPIVDQSSGADEGATEELAVEEDFAADEVTAADEAAVDEAAVEGAYGGDELTEEAPGDVAATPGVYAADEVTEVEEISTAGEGESAPTLEIDTTTEPGEVPAGLADAAADHPESLASPDATEQELPAESQDTAADYPGPEAPVEPVAEVDSDDHSTAETPAEDTEAEVHISTAEFDEAFEEAVRSADASGPGPIPPAEPIFVEGEYGPSSAQPGIDGGGPSGWEVKGTQGSLLFHTPDSPSYHQTRADVWFESEDAAKAAGFAHWDRKRR